MHLAELEVVNLEAQLSQAKLDSAHTKSYLEEKTKELETARNGLLEGQVCTAVVNDNILICQMARRT